MLIENKKLAILAAVLTFIGATAIFTGIIMYILNIPLSGMWEGQNQLYFFSAVLVAGGLASLVYGRGSTQRAVQAMQLVEETWGIEVSREDTWKVLRAVEHMPPFVVEKYVSMNINLVEEIEDQIIDYKAKLSDEDLSKIKKIMETPVPELQKFMEKLYEETRMEHFKILSEPQAQELITINRHSLKEILFKE